MNGNSTRRVRIEASGDGVVAHVGLHALGAFADRLGLGDALSGAVQPTGERAPVHDRGKVLTHAALMLAGGGECCADIETLRADERHVHLRAWLYRVAHNRCIDHLRRPVPPAADVFEVSRKPLHDPIEEAQRREDLSRLVEDVGRLPDQQRSALLMREIDGMSYADLASALEAHGVRMSRPLGFRNNYALGMRKDVAAAKGITRVSDLRGHPELRLGVIHGFLDRPDGRPARDVQRVLEQRRGRARLGRGAITGPEGRVRFEDLSPATYHLSFRPWPYRDLVRPEENPYTPLEPLTLVRPDDHLTLDVRLMAGVPVAVSVEPSDGETNYFSAAFRNVDTGLVLRQSFDRAGDLERVLARGRWAVSVQTSRGYLLESVERDRQPVAVRPTSPPLGQSVRLDLAAEPFGTHLVWHFLAEARLTGRVIFEGERGGVQISARLLEPGPALVEL